MALLLQRCAIDQPCDVRRQQAKQDTDCLPLSHLASPADFAADLAALFPEGVDVVLNSLTSPGMLAASLAVLKHGGTFVEVGKRDIWAAARMAQVRFPGSASAVCLRTHVA